MDRLNYHHLRYFREVAREGNLTRTAENVNLSQSALSTQIKNLEDRLGHALFERIGRQLKLTEMGNVVLDYADLIFATGEELVARLEGGNKTRARLRVGAISTLSRNFQIRFLRPVLERGDHDVTLRSGDEENLLERLKSLALDVVLMTEAPRQSSEEGFTAHLIAEQAVSAHGAPHLMQHKTLKGLLKNAPLIVPSESSIRTGFDALVARLNIKPHVIAEVDDMAMVRLLARNATGVAIAPDVVLADEIRNGIVETSPHDLAIVETFYAVTAQRNFPHPALAQLLTEAA